jgi:hypothetical protein
MKISSLTLTTAMIMILTGCISTRDYPRCYLFRAPADQDLTLANGSLQTFFDQALRVNQYALGKDWVVVKTDSQTHGRIANVWPALGCINLRHPPPQTGAINDKWTVARCQEYLEESIRKIRRKNGERPTTIAARFSEFTCH